MTRTFGNFSQHNFPSGPIKECQVCGSGDLELVLDLGQQPLCDTLIDDSTADLPEAFFPLRQFWCRNCTLNQIDYAVDGSLVYHPRYPYRSGITRELAEYQSMFGEEIVTRFGVPKNSLCVDIGSNDGTLLKGFQRLGMRVTGVEPTDISQIAIADGVPTLQRFFNRSAAEAIIQKEGHAQVVTATNVFAHMASLGDVIEGIYTLLDSNGYFVLENHYLAQVVKTGQFDTIYHEHLRTYSLKSLVTLFSYYDFSVISAREVDRYGGNIRVVVQKGKGRKCDDTVAQILAAEESQGLGRPEVYANFRKLAEKAKLDLVDFCIQAKRQGKTLVGNSCPGRCATLLNYYGIGPDLMPYIAEQPTSLKLGKYLPGKHIPIVENSVLTREQPDYVVLLAWHYAEPIRRYLRERGVKSKLVLPLPELKVLDN